MTVRVAYVEEPPFYWTAEDGSVDGADVELARVVLAAGGETSVDFVAAAFDDLLTGVQAGEWDMNVPIFVTPERAEQVAFSVPVWSLGDGFLVEHGNPLAVTNYASVAAHGAIRLGLIPGQVQFAAAKAAGISDDQIVTFANQPDAVIALLAGEIDAFAATTVGNRAVVAITPGLDAVPAADGGDATAAMGAFSFAAGNKRLIRTIDAQLRLYRGSADHRTRMAKYGITRAEIDGALLIG
jgi:polar amino acid transport system substrate-binding protein